MPDAEKRDYYEVLGINKNATLDEIEKARKKLVKKWHPDLNPNNKEEAEKKMKEINEAYDVLKDPKLRAQYDQYGHAAFTGGGGQYRGQGGFDPSDIFGGFEGFGGSGDIFGEIFGSFFGGGARGRQQHSERGPVRGADLRYDLTISFEDAAFGKEMTIKVPRLETCKDCNGSGAEKGSTSEICPECHGMGQKQVVRQMGPMRMQTFVTCDRCHGSGKIIKNPCKHCHGDGKVKVTRDIKVTIPKGVNVGNKLRIQGGGQAGDRGGQPGDLIVYINIKPHELFKRRDADVYCDVPISFVQAALGGTVEAPTIDGKIEMKIPAGIQSGTVQRIKGKGIPHLRGEGRGDEYVTIKVLTPQNLTERQKNLLQQFESGVDDNKVHPEKKNFIDKLKSFFS